MEVGQVKKMMMPASWVSVATMVAWIAGDVAGVTTGGAASGWAAMHQPWAVVVTALLVGLTVIWAGAGRSARWLIIGAVGVCVLFTLDAIVLGSLRIVGASTAAIPVVGDAIGLIGSLALSVMAIVGLLRLLPLTAAARPELEASPADPSQDSRAPTWGVDQAAGAHWQTAGAAAAGAAAHDRGRPGEPGGWTAALDRSRQPAPGSLRGATPPSGPAPGSLRGATPPSGPAPAPIREPDAFGPEGRATDRAEPGARERARVGSGAGAPDGDPGVRPGARVADDDPAGRMPTGRTPGAPDPQALAQQYSAEAADTTDSTMPDRRLPPRWIPLDRGQPPRPGQ